MKAGDLIRDKGDGDLGLVISPVRNYNPGNWKNKSIGYVMVQWRSYTGPRVMDLTAVQNGWVEIVSESR